MRPTLLKAFVLLALLPASLQADIKADMTNAELSLMQVVENALNEGQTIENVIAQMIAIDPSQAQSAIAAAIQADPDEIEVIVRAAILAGIDSATVVSVAINANGGERSERIIAAAVNASAANQHAAIVQAAVEALPKTAAGTAGFSATTATALAVRPVGAGGGGAAFTAAESREVQALLGEVEAALLTANVSQAEANVVIEAITAELTKSQADVATSVTALNQIKTNLAAASATFIATGSGSALTADIATILTGIDSVVASIAGDAPTS